MTGSEFDRARAEIPSDVPLPYAVELPVLGIPIRFASNSADALGLVEEAFGAWRRLSERPDLIADATARFRLIVHEGEEGAAPHALVTCQVPEPGRVIYRTPRSLGLVDGANHDAVAYLTSALLADRAHVRLEVIEGMTLTLASSRNRFPVHAAAVARGEAALLLAGLPGTGKSTLAYQAHRDGLRVLSEDACYVQVEPALRLWGTPGRAHLLDAARPHFPELAGRAPTVLGNGDRKIVVDLAGEWPAPGATAPVASHASVCLLERRGGPAGLSRASAEEVRAFLRDGLGISRFRFGDDLDRALERLAPSGGWRLSLSSNPADAAPLLADVLDELDQSSSVPPR